VSRKIIITTPFPAPDEIAAFYKIPAKRVAELNQMMDEIREGEAKKVARSLKKAAKTKAGRKPSARQKVTGSKR
jgi:hypothetical protein